MENDVNSTAKLPENWTVKREDLRTRLSFFSSEFKMAELLARFASKKQANYWLKT